MSHRYLSRLQKVLSADRTVFSIDLPGYGGLPKPDHDVSVVTMASGLAEVIESLDVEPVILVGHSMGAQWVVEVGVLRPELVGYVVTIGPVADHAHRSISAQMIALARDTLGESPVINAIVFSDYLRCGVPWYLAQARNMLAYRLEERLRAMVVPLLIIRGARDPIAGPEWCRTLRDRARESALVHIPRQHHVAQHSAPRSVASAILAYTSSADAGALRVS